MLLQWRIGLLTNLCYWVYECMFSESLFWLGNAFSSISTEIALLPNAYTWPPQSLCLPVNMVCTMVHMDISELFVYDRQRFVHHWGSGTWNSHVMVTVIDLQLYMWPLYILQGKKVVLETYTHFNILYYQIYALI